MGLLDSLRKKKEELPLPTPSAPSFRGIPIDQILLLQQQGLTNNQIIQTLQRQGYTPQQIYDALAQAESQVPLQPLDQDFNTPQPEQEQPSQNFEHLAETIVEEKWQTFQRDLGKITEWKDALTSRTDKIEQTVQDLRADLDGLHKAIVARIGEYDKNLLDVGTEIGRASCRERV